MEKWKKIGSPVVMAGKFGKKLITQIFLNPRTGKEEEYVLFSQKDWSVVLAITEDKKVITVMEYKQGRDAVGVELPAGTASFEDEDPLSVIKRELREETGFEAGEMIDLGIGWMCTRNSPTRFHVFLALNCKRVADQNLDENEIIDFELVPQEEWIASVISGSITEPSAVVATVRSLPFIGLSIK